VPDAGDIQVSPFSISQRPPSPTGAGKNSLAEGLRIIGAGLSDYTDGGSDKTFEKKHKPMKSEAPYSLANGWFS
jgi:hypothetical protein